MPRRTPLDQLEPQRICFIKPSALGDVVQALPVLSGLRQRWPKAHISWVVNHALAGLIDGHSDLDEVIAFHRHGRHLYRLKAMWQLGRRLRKGRFDLTIDQQGLFRSGLMTWMTGASTRVGFAHAREGATLAYSHCVDVRWRNVSAVDRNWEMAQAFGLSGPAPVPRLPVDADARQWAQAQVASLPRPLLVIHPGAQWQTKRWPPEHFAWLAQRAREAFGVGLALVGGRGEGRLCQPIVDAIGPEVVSFAEKTDLKELAAILAEADVYLSGDSGPMHMAAAVGTPVVAVFTCTSPVRAGPYGTGHRVVATRVDCAASYRKRCSSMVCMSELTPQRVWPALEAALAERLEAGRRLSLSG